MLEGFGVKMLLSVQKEDVDNVLNQMKTDDLEIDQYDEGQTRAIYLQLHYQCTKYIFLHDLKPDDDLVKEIVSKLTLLFKMVTWGRLQMSEDKMSSLLYEELIPYNDFYQYIDGCIKLPFWEIEKGVSEFNSYINGGIGKRFDKKGKPVNATPNW